jgi:uracil phosphoribosyltransferase
MVIDCQYQALSFAPSEIQHQYGANIHILNSPLMLTLLARLGEPSTKQPEINHLVKKLYEHLSDVMIDTLFPRKIALVDTRMKVSHAQGTYAGEIIDSHVPCVSVAIARAGTFPSHICYEKLNYFMNPQLLRQDHLYMARATDEKGVVTGVTVSGSKIGGSVDNAIVLFPDPMGATGGTIVHAYHHYKTKVGGTAKIMMALHLIVTPEYLRNVTTQCPDLHVFALRLDRGLSAPEVLKERPGKFWDKEKGLNDHQYIVPGAGGLGEILNNSWC